MIKYFFFSCILLFGACSEKQDDKGRKLDVEPILRLYQSNKEIPFYCCQNFPTDEDIETIQLQEEIKLYNFDSLCTQNFIGRKYFYQNFFGGAHRSRYGEIYAIKNIHTNNQVTGLLTYNEKIHKLARAARDTSYKSLEKEYLMIFDSLNNEINEILVDLDVRAVEDAKDILEFIFQDRIRSWEDLNMDYYLDRRRINKKDINYRACITSILETLDTSMELYIFKRNKALYETLHRGLICVDFIQTEDEPIKVHMKSILDACNSVMSDFVPNNELSVKKQKEYIYKLTFPE